MRLLLIDNYDSFTYNLYQQLERLGAEVEVKKNDEMTIGQIKRGGYDAIVISPGPKKPKDAGISCDVIREFYKTKPILGVCLGHQCIGEVFGAKVVRAPCVMHGKVSEVKHEGIGIFREAKNPFNAARYHSLVLDCIPKDCIQTARTQDGIIMGIQHKKYPVFGVQFHPESFLTQGGDILIRNFLTLKHERSECPIPYARSAAKCAPPYSFPAFLPTKWSAFPLSPSDDLCPGTDL